LSVEVPNGHLLAGLPEGLVQQNAEGRLAHATLFCDNGYSHIVIG
jgi:hypothetical protein